MNLRILIVTIMLEQHLNNCSVLNKRYWLELESQALLYFFFLFHFYLLKSLREEYLEHTHQSGALALHPAT